MTWYGFTQVGVNRNNNIHDMTSHDGYALLLLSILQYVSGVCAYSCTCACTSCMDTYDKKNVTKLNDKYLQNQLHSI